MKSSGELGALPTVSFIALCPTSQIEAVVNISMSKWSARHYLMLTDDSPPDMLVHPEAHNRRVKCPKPKPAEWRKWLLHP